MKNTMVAFKNPMHKWLMGARCTSGAAPTRAAQGPKHLEPDHCRAVGTGRGPWGVGRVRGVGQAHRPSLSTPQAGIWPARDSYQVSASGWHFLVFTEGFDPLQHTGYSRQLF